MLLTGCSSLITDFVGWRQTISALPNPIHAVFYELLLFTGLWKSEALTLKWKNVHEDRIHLPMTKNGRSFDLPIGGIDWSPWCTRQNAWHVRAPNTREIVDDTTPTLTSKKAQRAPLQGQHGLG